MRFKRVMAASMAAVMAIGSSVVCEISASATELEEKPSGVETVLYSADLSGVTTTFTTAWQNGDWTQITGLDPDSDLMLKDNVYVKVKLSNLGTVTTGEEPNTTQTPWSDLLTWGFSNYSWAGVVKWYNNNTDSDTGDALPENFDVTFVPTADSTADSAVCYAHLSDFAMTSWGGIAGNIQAAHTAGFTIESIEIVEISAAVSKITIPGYANRTVTYGDNAQILSATANSDAYDDTKITWESSNTDVATVDSTGKVTFVGAGTAKITATYDGDSNITASVDYTVDKKDVAAAITATDVTGAESADDALTKAKAAVTATVADLTKDTDYTVDVKLSADKKSYTAEVKLTAAAAKNYNLTGTATATKSVGYAVSGLKLSTQKLTLVVTSSAGVQINATIEPEDLAEGTVEWSSKDAAVAAVDQTGLVTPKAVGKTTITATVKGTNFSADCDVEVVAEVNPAASITLNPTTINGTVGENATITATVTGEDSSKECTDQITWTSSDTDVATVKNGVVTFKSAGTAKITATAGKKSAECTVTVKAATVAVESVTLDKSTAELEVDGTLTLTATVTPDNATDKTVTWSSSNTDVATVDKDGKVTAVKAGTATITAKSGEKSAECVITVKAKKTDSDNKPGDDTNDDSNFSGYVDIEETDMGTDWGKSVQVPAQNVSDGSTVKIKYTVGKADYHQIQVMDSNWTVLTSLADKANQWGTIDVSGDGELEFKLNAADAAAITAGGMVISGYDITITDVSFNVQKDKNTYTDAGSATKVNSVKTTDKGDGTLDMVAVFSISAEEAEQISGYTITFTRKDGKSASYTIDTYYDSFSYKDNGTMYEGEASDGNHLLVLNLINVDNNWGGLTIKITPNK